MKTIAAAFTLLLISSIAVARPARPRGPGGDVHMTMSMRERLFVLAVMNSTNPGATSVGQLQGLLSLDAALDLEATRAWISVHPKANPFDAPDDQRPIALTRGEADALVSVVSIKPTKERPLDLASARVLDGILYATQQAIAAATPKGKSTP